MFPAGGDRFCQRQKQGWEAETERKNDVLKQQPHNTHQLQNGLYAAIFLGKKTRPKKDFRYNPG